MSRTVVDGKVIEATEDEHGTVIVTITDAPDPNRVLKTQEELRLPVGTRIRVVVTLASHGPQVGDTGTVCFSAPNIHSGVAFDRTRPEQHNLGGRCADFHGWWLSEGEGIEVVVIE